MYINVQRQQGDCLIQVMIQGSAQGITALFGPSGAGKSSIINMVAGLLAPDQGTISINGHCLFDSKQGINLPPEQRHIGYIFQEGRLFPHMSVKSNLLYGQNRNQAQGKSKIGFEQVIKLLGIESLLARRPRTLSGGEKQRVAFGRAVLSKPDLLLMDEPLASLDSARKKELLPFIQQLNADFGIPILYVSHSIEELHFLTTNITKLANGKVV